MMTEKNTPTSDDTSVAGDPADAGTPTPAPTGHRRFPRISTDADGIRTLVARILWAVCVLFACILAIAVLLLALEANPDNDLVRWIGHRSADVDLGFFALDNPIKEFDDAKQTALFNYGIAAVVWLLVGRLLDRVVRP